MIGKRSRSIGAGCLTLASALVMLTGCTREVPPASVGVKFNANTGISKKLIRPQVVWLGFRERLIVYPTSIHNATYVKNAHEGEKAGDDSIKASTAEGAILPTDVTVAYHVAPEDVLKAFNNFGTEDLSVIQRRFIRWTTIYGVNVVAGQRSIFDLSSKERAQFGPDVKNVIGPLLAEWGLTVDDVYIGEVYPNDEIRQRIEQRIGLKNQLELARNEQQRAGIEARTSLTNASKQAELNRLLQQGNEKMLELKRLELQKEAIERWDGKTPLVGDAKIPFTDISPSR
jgi:regulator of protease activity HflC (stomatin/prohibitin superfamily)